MSLLTRALSSGSAASLLSAALIAARAKADSGSAVQGLNDTSHWVWGDRAFAQRGMQWRFTVPGFFIHYLSGVFWAVLFEWILDRSRRPSTAKIATMPARNTMTGAAPTKMAATASSPQNICRTAALVTAVANIVDFQFTPHRLTPGFEQHLSRRSLALVYLGFGVGLAAAACLRRAGSK